MPVVSSDRKESPDSSLPLIASEPNDQQRNEKRANSSDNKNPQRVFAFTIWHSPDSGIDADEKE
jgi:hypothetical protein